MLQQPAPLWSLQLCALYHIFPCLPCSWRPMLQRPALEQLNRMNLWQFAALFAAPRCDLPLPMWGALSGQSDCQALLYFPQLQPTTLFPMCSSYVGGVPHNPPDTAAFSIALGCMPCRQHCVCGLNEQALQHPQTGSLSLLSSPPLHRACPAAGTQRGPSL